MDLKGAQAVDILKTSLEMVEGIVDVKVSPSDSVVQVEFDPSTVGVRHVLKNIEVCTNKILDKACKGPFYLTDVYFNLCQLYSIRV